MTGGLREIREFFTLEENCLWITFANKHLYWAFAKTEVHPADTMTSGASRYRRTIGGWKNTDIAFEPLKVDSLSSRLTQLAAYRATICTINAERYLLQKINCSPAPLVLQAQDAREALVTVADKLIRGLHWRDLEILTDLIFARSGWLRMTQVGEQLADIDMLLEQPTISERVFGVDPISPDRWRLGLGTEPDELARRAELQA